MRGKKNKILLVISLLLVLALPSSALATIELRYVNARQAYVDTFFNKTVAQLISEESIQHNINPRLILIMLQRESSSIYQTAPSSTTRATWPLFYNYDERMAACLNGDESACNDSKYGKADYSYRAENYGGVGQQIAYATAQLRNLAGDGNPANGTYCDDSRVVSVDGQDITTDNAESCALYKYTPHQVSYNTSSAFYTNWISWWSGSPNGGDFTATNVISPANFSYQAMTTDEINAFLLTHGEGGAASWLANYTIAEYISVPYPAVVAPTPPPAPARKAGDANGDGQTIGIADLSVLCDTWGQSITPNTGADLNGDGVVNIADLSILCDNWGQ